MSKEQSVHYLSRHQRQGILKKEADLQKKFRALLPREQIGDRTEFHALILAETWRTMATMCQYIENFAAENDFKNAVDRDGTDFITVMNTEMTLLRSRPRELQRTLNALLAVFYKLKQ
jgi:hypothetical protein